jgi:hypothetical protein
MSLFSEKVLKSTNKMRRFVWVLAELNLADHNDLTLIWNEGLSAIEKHEQ